MSVAEDSPSAERRKALKEADAANELRVLDSCPLSKYIDIAGRLLDHFQDAVDGRRLDEAYVFGLRFANLCLSSLPQHPEWRSDTSKKSTKRLTSQVRDVLCMMDVIKQRMDAEELAKIKIALIAKEKEEALEKEAEDRRKRQLDDERQREQNIRDALEAERARFLAEQRHQRQEELKKFQKTAKKKGSSSKIDETGQTGNKKEPNITTKNNVQKAEKKESTATQKEIEQSAMAKLKAMQAQMPSTDQRITVVATKKYSIKQAKGSGRKAKETTTTNKCFVAGKKTQITESKDAKVPLPCQNEAPEIKADIISLPEPSVAENSTTSVAENGIVIPKNISHTIEQEDDRDENLEQQSSSDRSNEMKKSSEPQVTKEENKVKPENRMKKMDSGSARSIKSKKNTPIKFIKSKIKASKATFSVKPLDWLPSSGKIPEKDHSGNGTIDTFIVSQQTPRSLKEKAIIDKLKRTITVQEDRLEDIEGKQIPYLLSAAKTFLKEDEKKEALKCLAHKKKLDRQVDTIKAAVFNMETQMFMLESAIEDRYVKRALEEAATAIAGFQQDVGNAKDTIVDLAEMSASLPELDVGESTDEELLEELEEWLSPEEKMKSQDKKGLRVDDDDVSLLSIPSFLPAAPATTPASPNHVLDTLISE